MRPLVLLGSLILVLAGFIIWRTYLQVPVSNPPIAVDANTGVVVLGLPHGEASNTAFAANTTSKAPNTALGAKEDVIPQEATATLQDQNIAEASGGTPPIVTEEVQSPGEEAVSPTESGATIYFVKEDDTLYRILRFAYDKANQELVEAVAAANQMDDPSELMVGQKLILPHIDGYQTPRGNN